MGLDFKHFMFTGRERRGATDLVNSMLNYGYGALLSYQTRGKVAQAVMERLNTPLKFRGKNMSLSGIIHHQARELAACIKGKKVYQPFIAKW